MAGTLMAGMMPRKRLHAQGATAEPFPPSGLERSPAQMMPDELFTDADGIEHRLADFRGRPVIVHLWATWCGPCVKELPALAALKPPLEASGIALLPVAVDHRGVEVVKPFLEKLKLDTFDTFYDQRRAIPASLEEETLPFTLFLDRQGMLICRHPGPLLWSAPDALPSLLHLMT
ncbi:TlpA disulfide reductase family protein [Acetobacter conturbans]|nr:TlpA disulfide reductase family protein [Acetobacter conturbans]